MIDVPACLMRIDPDARFSTTDEEVTFWESDRPQPTRAEIEAAWAQILAEA